MFTTEQLAMMEGLIFTPAHVVKLADDGKMDTFANHPAEWQVYHGAQAEDLFCMEQGGPLADYFEGATIMYVVARADTHGGVRVQAYCNVEGEEALFHCDIYPDGTTIGWESLSPASDE